MNVTVACVLRSGGLYGREYVERLRAGVEKHLPGARWLCLSDVPEVATMPLAHDWPGWWAKMELFRPGLFQGPALYIDLDTIPAGDLGDIAEACARHRMIMLRSFLPPSLYGSGVMGWSGDLSALYQRFARAAGRFQKVYSTAELWGDQAFIRASLSRPPTTWQEILPGQVVSWKVDCRGGVPAGARLVCFHGAPRPHEIGWQIKERSQSS